MNFCATLIGMKSALIFLLKMTKNAQTELFFL